MKSFILDEKYTIKCKYIKNAKGFIHKAVLFKNGNVVKTKISQYLNRSWERFEFETVILELITGYFDKEQAGLYREVVKTFN